jgi:hypothetical protein
VIRYLFWLLAQYMAWFVTHVGFIVALVGLGALVILLSAKKGNW